MNESPKACSWIELILSSLVLLLTKCEYLCTSVCLHVAVMLFFKRFRACCFFHREKVLENVRMFPKSKTEIYACDFFFSPATDSMQETLLNRRC